MPTYKIRKTREARGPHMTQMELDVGKFYIVDVQRNFIVEHHFDTVEEARARVRELKKET